jgi:hypothetical protein
MGSWLAETRIPGIAKGARLRPDDGRHSASNGIERVRESKTTPVEICDIGEQDNEPAVAARRAE